VSRLINRLLFDSLGFGYFPTKLTRRRELESLIERLRPVETGLDLVRLGPAGDGGYLVPDDLEGIEACFSPGVSDASGFEAACADRGMRVFLADRSVEQPAEAHEQFVFIKKFVGATSGGDFINMSDWAAQAGLEPDSDLLLQMDIEGYEYETLLATPDALLRRFRIMVIEFHRLHQLWSAPYFRLASAVFNKLLESHSCVHIHPNNARSSVTIKGIEIPRLMEFTFLRKDRFQARGPARLFPHPLDADNTSKPGIPLPACWQG
jgi:hypothetical protein